MSHYSSFVVKLWVDDCERVTRGYIQHVNTQDSVYFASLDRMMAFMSEHLHLPLNGLPPEMSIRTVAEIEGTPDDSL